MIHNKLAWIDQSVMMLEMINLNREELRTKEHFCSAMNVRSVDDYAIKIL